MDQAIPAVVETRHGRDPGRDLRRVGVNRDHWYPLAWSGELKAGKPLAVRFAGDPIVLVRPKEGAVFALEDRCAHRQVPLSNGLVEGCAIRCGYHGWAYDQSGRCTDVPYLGKDKLPNGVRAYPCREAEGLILVFPGDPALADAVPLPALGSVADPRYKTRRFGQEVACHYSFMHENLMDMNHQFLHRKQMGNMVPRYMGGDKGEGFVEARYTFSRVGGKQPWAEAAIFGERRAVSAEVPAGKAVQKDLMTIRTEYPYQTLRIQTGDDAPVMDLWIAYVPVDAAQRRNRTFGLLSIKRPKIPGLLEAGWPVLVLFTERIFREDREIVEMEQAAHDAQGGDWNQEVFPVIRNLRALLRDSGGETVAAG
ncbi:Rieske 2Fe-2S domain-containing protein [Muricoccus vinaceus]|uniref:Rieske 2Fe-2S domain-containing protein n=1 Tax=Muricoccus vinaceus TaxID=424704 RepID=A0ABV6IS74_9PROT